MKEMPVESPAKLLDDLFKKTTATPIIYWLPLSDEEADGRAKDREAREKTRKEAQAAREEEAKARYEKRSPPPKRVCYSHLIN